MTTPATPSVIGTDNVIQETKISEMEMSGSEKSDDEKPEKKRLDVTENIVSIRKVHKVSTMGTRKYS